MRRGSDAFGRSVITYDTGERIARVEDLIFAESSNQIVGLLIAESRLFSSARVIPFHSIQAFGPDVIVVPDKSAVKRLEQLPKIEQLLKHNNVLKGTRIMTTNGRNLGTMVDLYFDDQTGEVEGYDVSGGLFADAYSGRSFVPAPQTLKIGKDVAFVPPEVAALMEEQIGGIRGAFQTTGDKLQETTQLTGQKMQLAAEGANDKLRETTQIASDKIQSLTDTVVASMEQKAFVVGKTVNHHISTANGILLVAQGQLVTPSIAEEAEHLGLLDQLYQTVGGSLSASADQIQQVTQASNDKLRETTQSAKERLVEASRSSMASLTDAAVDPAQQKVFVVGKIVSQAVIAPDGTQLLDEGEQVTPLVAAVADSLGVLDQLYRAAGGSLTVKLSRAANVALASRIIEQAKGRRVHEAVQTPDGIFIAAPGQIVTQQVIERTKTYHKESELLSAVGLTPSEVVGSSASGFLSQTSQQLHGGATQAQTSVSNLWERCQQKFADLWHSNAEIIEKQRLKHALGRPVTRVILSPQDDVILNVGELITHQAIGSAQQGGVLDILLSSVYDKKPELSTQELRAFEPGSASLKHKEHVNNGEEENIYQPIN